MGAAVERPTAAGRGYHRRQSTTPPRRRQAQGRRKRPMTRTDPDVQRIAELYRETLDSVSALEKYARIGRLIDHVAVTPAHVHAPSRNNRTWLWSDLHLFHHEIIRHCNRPFAGIHHMASALLREAKRGARRWRRRAERRGRLRPDRPSSVPGGRL